MFLFFLISYALSQETTEEPSPVVCSLQGSIEACDGAISMLGGSCIWEAKKSKCNSVTIAKLEDICHQYHFRSDLCDLAQGCSYDLTEMECDNGLPELPEFEMPEFSPAFFAQGGNASPADAIVTPQLPVNPVLPATPQMPVNPFMGEVGEYEPPEQPELEGLPAMMAAAAAMEAATTNTGASAQLPATNFQFPVMQEMTVEEAALLPCENRIGKTACQGSTPLAGGQCSWKYDEQKCRHSEVGDTESMCESLGPQDCEADPLCYYDTSDIMEPECSPLELTPAALAAITASMANTNADTTATDGSEATVATSEAADGTAEPVLMNIHAEEYPSSNSTDVSLQEKLMYATAGFLLSSCLSLTIFALTCQRKRPSRSDIFLEDQSYVRDI